MATAFAISATQLRSPTISGSRMNSIKSSTPFP
jgi:hypothetical protein